MSVTRIFKLDLTRVKKIRTFFMLNVFFFSSTKYINIVGRISVYLNKRNIISFLIIILLYYLALVFWIAFVD